MILSLSHSSHFSYTHICHAPLSRIR